MSTILPETDSNDSQVKSSAEFDAPDDATRASKAGLSSMSPEMARVRGSLCVATFALLTIVGIWLMADLLHQVAWSWRTGLIFGLFILLFSQIAAGFCLALFGLFLRIRGGDPWHIERRLPPAGMTGKMASTAIVIPIFNEDVGRVFRGVENMFISLQETGLGAHLDLFILSDSNDPNCWIDEECAWMDLCRRHQAFGRIFYRKRRISVHGKSGNVADFCRRWGQKYRYMIVLDADSVMTGETLVRLVQAMEKNPRVGIIQTAPRLVRGTSLFRRALQFATRLVGPLFSAGSAYWHMGAGNYWGHNAILRLQPFMEFCDLPDLPGPAGTRLHIMSHDTIEAALMCKSGYEVWLAHEAEGTYEEGPPNLTESLKRDRRWCQGNLQHFWFLFAPRLNFASRVHIYFGLMAYLGSPLWLLFTGLSLFEMYDRQRFAILSTTAHEWAMYPAHSALALFALTMTLLFLPKFFGMASLLPQAKKYGGAGALFLSTLGETLLSVLIAPVLAFFYSKFVLLTIFGRRVAWKTQQREEDGGLTWSAAFGDYWQPTVFGILATFAAQIWVPTVVPWLSPMLLGWLFAIPFARWTSRDRLGAWTRAHGIFLIPEETSLPRELQNLDLPAQPEARRVPLPSQAQYHGLLQAVLDPYVNAIHLSLLRLRHGKLTARHDYLKELRARLLSAGPDALSARERASLLADSESVVALHKDLWRRPKNDLHPWWQDALRLYNIALTVRKNSPSSTGRGE